MVVVVLVEGASVVKWQINGDFFNLQGNFIFYLFIYLPGLMK